MAKQINGNEITQFVSETNANPSWIPLRRTDGTVTDSYSFTQSAEVDATRQGAEQVATEVAVAGSIESEFPLADAGLQALIKNALHNVYTTVSVSATVSFSGSNIVDSGATNAFADIEIGDFFVPFGATLNGNTLFSVTAKADDNTLTLSPAPQAESGQAVAFTVKSIKNSNQVQELSFQERIKTETDTLYNTFQDVIASSISVTASTGALITASTSMIGYERLNQNTQVSGSSDQAASDASVIGSVKGFESLFIDGVVVPSTDLCPTEVTLEINNGSTANYCLGKLGAATITEPSIVVTGTLNSYVKTGSVAELLEEMNKMRGETKFALAFALKDTAGNRMVFDMPYAQYTALEMNERSNGTSLMNSGAYSADGKGVKGYTVRMTYLAKP